MIRPLHLLAAAALALAAADAPAQTVPFKITGGGVAPDGLPLPGQDPRVHPSSGTATHLGRYGGFGAVRTDWAAPDPATGQIVGEFGSGSPYLFTAADGSELATYYGRTDHGAATPGTFALTVLGVLGDGSLVVEAAWVAEFVVQPDLSTGRFAGATGSWVMYAYSEPFVLGSDDPLAYSWEGTGTITFARP